MIKFVKGNIFDSKAEALVNTVNTVGVMGKGIALQFKKNFPNNFKLYSEACKNSKIKIGKLLLTEDENLAIGNKIIINFPTKTTWKKPSEYEYIEKGLDDLIRLINQSDIKSVAIPPLGSGNGGLDWAKVKSIIKEKLYNINAEIIVYEPTKNIIEALKKERVKLTNARAMLLFMLYKLARNGEFVSEFSSEKVCYFLQRFGAEKYFKLKYQPNFYGPYSGKVKYVLNYLNGSYIMGYSDMNKKPFEELNILKDGEKDVLRYIEKNNELKIIVENTNKFLTGFYSNFALELLSTIDFISLEKGTFNKKVIKKELESWSNRKRTLFSNESYIDIAINHLHNTDFLNSDRKLNLN
jgi:O-acetyl-ADP-ribose deacetylase (regulator of RNase III)/uncharacterized protein YwgA